MKAKLPFIVILGITSLILLSIYRFFEYRVQLADDFQQFQIYREEKMLSYSEIGAQLIRENKLTDLKNLLEVARKARDLDFYIIQYKGSSLLLSAYGDHPEEIDIEYKVIDQFMRGPETSTYSTMADPDNKFTVGINRSFENHFEINLEQQKISEIQIVIGPILLFLILSAYFFKDIKNILLQLRSRGKRDFKHQTTKTLEGEILLGGLSGYSENLMQLEQKAKAFENQVLPSLRSEISAGLHPPYSFECTLVRTDINNFSTIFNQFDTEKLMMVINEFFTEVSHIVARYDGLVHEFVGDEVIFYIKDKPNENSILKALSALRDINEAALRFSQYTQAQLGYPLTVKSSLAQGRLRFGHLVNGFTLAGAVLIETVRVLSQIVEKEENLICFNQIYNRDLQPLCELSTYAQVYLKGYTDKVSLVRYLRHQALSPLLQNPTTQNILIISYYRSNKDIAEILKALREQQQQQKYDDKVMLEIIKILNQFNLTQYYSNLAPAAPSQVADELLKLLETLAAASLAQAGQSHVLSAACKLVQNLMSASEFESYFDLRFSHLLRHPDHRVVANAIDVIAFFQHEKGDQLLRPFLDHQNVRVAANALVYEASRAITSEIVQRLKKSLNSQDPHIVAGSLYALGEIAQHHRNSDPVYYNSQVEFLNLLNGISHFLNSTHPMVARQAAVAVRKSNLKLAA